jgi:putative pyruvate formate lyase activating enzyme
MPGRADRFRVASFEPAYVALQQDGRLKTRAEQARFALEACRLCPRACGARRLDGETGSCGLGRRAVVSSAFSHFGEEDCLRGRRGSGTIFFSGCSLRCCFCQNADISWLVSGAELDAAELAATMLVLQERGCHNVNLVTPTHVVPQLIEALAIAAEQGLRLPIVYNSGGYDRAETLALLDGVVDVYMPDFKFWRSETAARYASAPDYPEVARRALVEMQRQVGALRFSADGLARRGVLVRHLVLPGLADESGAILEWLARELSPDTYVNVMAQYRPAWRVGQPDAATRRRFAEIDRTPRTAEIEAVYEAGREAGLWRFDQRRVLARLQPES